MDPKKTPAADLSNKWLLHFSIGLTTSLLLVISAFNYRVYDDTSKKNLSNTGQLNEEIIEVPPTQQLPPPPQQIVQPKIIEVPNEKKIQEEIKFNMDVEISVDAKIQEVTIMPPTVEEEKEDPHQVFLIVEESAAPQGGLPAFYEHVKSQMKYPAQARRMLIEGRVFVEFIIEKDGSLTDVKVVKGIGAGCDEEAVRVLENSPRWKPAKQRGKPVRQRMVLPIIFKLA